MSRILRFNANLIILFKIIAITYTLRLNNSWEIITKITVLHIQFSLSKVKVKFHEIVKNLLKMY